jgi:hypothetical protein
MKKVSLALSAVGVTPALILMMPGAAAAVHAPAGAVITAAQAPGKTVRLPAAASCVGRQTTKKSSQSHSFTMWVYHTSSNGCIGGVSGFLTDDQTGLSMRTRAYAINAHGTKTRIYSHYHNGNAVSGKGTTFYQGIHTTYGGVKQQVCAALVLTGNHAAVQDGPVCVSFPS